VRGRLLCGPALVVLLLAGCTADPPSHGVALPVRPAESVLPEPSPSRPPVVNSDGCKGLITPAQVAKAAGFAVEPKQGDGAGAAVQYTDGLKTLGLTANVRMCLFGNAGGDQVTVVALGFPDVGQASKLFETGQSSGLMKPVGGVGDAAISDRSKALVTRRDKAVVAVYLVVKASPDVEHLGALRGVASAALAKA
jgi:hypothetical protein